MSKPDICESSWQRHINETAETLAKVEAEKITNAAILQKKLEEAAADECENTAAIYLQRMYALARFSSDYIDIAILLLKYPGLQEHLSGTVCLEKARNAAKIPGDWLEIEAFKTKLDSHSSITSFFSLKS